MTLLADKGYDRRADRDDRRLDVGSVREAAPAHDRERRPHRRTRRRRLPVDVEDISGALGRGGYEGIQNDSDGNLWIVEDIGGANKPGTVNAKFPNSFIYRYVPAHKGDLSTASCRRCRC